MHHRMKRIVATLTLAAGLFACDDGGKSTNNVNNVNNTNNTNNVNNANNANNTNNTNNANNGDCGAPGDTGPRFGQTLDRFELRVGDGWRVFSGRIFDGTPPDPFAETAREGHCRLLESALSFCDPACEWGEFCLDGVCETYPGLRSAGALTLTGIAAVPVTVNPDEYGNYSWDNPDAFTVSRLTLAAAGGVVPAFSLEACAPPTITPVGDWSALMEARAAGADVTLTWSAPVAGARVYLRMTTGIGTHGGVSPVEIECEGPDTGTLTLPGAYLDALYADGWSCGECGDNTLRRYFAAETQAADATLQLRVMSETTFWFRP